MWNLYVQIYDNNDKTGRDLQVNVSISLEKKTVGDSWERLKSSVQRQPKIHYNLQWNRKKKNPKVEGDKGNNARTVEQ